MERVLVVVHPGSACGSANFNIGQFEARAARDALADELIHWDGGIVVIDGELSDELPDYAHLADAIDRALERAAAADQMSVRLAGDDPDQVEVIEEVAVTARWKRRSVECTVTGAWFHPEDGGGCVGSVHARLRSLGIRSEVSECAVQLDGMIAV